MKLYKASILSTRSKHHDVQILRIEAEHFFLHFHRHQPARHFNDLRRVFILIFKFMIFAVYCYYCIILIGTVHIDLKHVLVSKGCSVTVSQ